MLASDYYKTEYFRTQQASWNRARSLGEFGSGENVNELLKQLHDAYVKSKLDEDIAKTVSRQVAIRENTERAAQHLLAERHDEERYLNEQAVIAKRYLYPAIVQPLFEYVPAWSVSSITLPPSVLKVMPKLGSSSLAEEIEFNIKLAKIYNKSSESIYEAELQLTQLKRRRIIPNSTEMTPPKDNVLKRLEDEAALAFQRSQMAAAHAKAAAAVNSTASGLLAPAAKEHAQQTAQLAAAAALDSENKQRALDEARARYAEEARLRAAEEARLRATKEARARAAHEVREATRLLAVDFDKIKNATKEAFIHAINTTFGTLTAKYDSFPYFSTRLKNASIEQNAANVIRDEIDLVTNFNTDFQSKFIKPLQDMLPTIKTDTQKYKSMSPAEQNVLQEVRKVYASLGTDSLHNLMHSYLETHYDIVDCGSLGRNECGYLSLAYIITGVQGQQNQENIYRTFRNDIANHMRFLQKQPEFETIVPKKSEQSNEYNQTILECSNFLDRAEIDEYAWQAAADLLNVVIVGFLNAEYKGVPQKYFKIFQNSFLKLSNKRLPKDIVFIHNTIGHNQAYIPKLRQFNESTARAFFENNMPKEFEKVSRTELKEYFSPHSDPDRKTMLPFKMPQKYSSLPKLIAFITELNS